MGIKKVDVGFQLFEDISAADMAGETGIVSLSGASSLAAGAAITFGIATLAF